MVYNIITLFNVKQISKLFFHVRLFISGMTAFLIYCKDKVQMIQKSALFNGLQQK
jgi:hypothetical protein